MESSHLIDIQNAVNKILNYQEFSEKYLCEN